MGIRIIGLFWCARRDIGLIIGWVESRISDGVLSADTSIFIGQHMANTLGM